MATKTRLVAALAFGIFGVFTMRMRALSRSVLMLPLLAVAMYGCIGWVRSAPPVDLILLTVTVALAIGLPLGAESWQRHTGKPLSARHKSVVVAMLWIILAANVTIVIATFPQLSSVFSFTG